MRMSGGGSDVNVIVMGNKQRTSSSCSSDAFQFQALLSSPVLNEKTEDMRIAYSSSRSMGNLEEVISNGNVSKRPFYTSIEQEETGDEDMEDYLHPPEKKRRLTTEQVQFLERSFEVENKLEPERKIQLARDLGLQPRQVAVWFQNRRARWKTKQLERDYDLLKSRYENLRADYDNLLKEKDKLKAEVNFLEDKIHSKDQDLKIKTKDLETVDKKASCQSLFYSECLEKPEIETSIKNPPAICKHEDILSSGTDSSGVLDEDSPRHINCGQFSLADQVNSSHAFEAYQSDISLAEEEEEEEDGMSEILLPQTFHLLKVGGGLYPEALEVSCNDIFPIDDQGNLPWWEWP